MSGYVDQLGQEIGLNDLVVWGHSGRYAGTRIGRVYRVTENSVWVWIFSKDQRFDYEAKRYVTSATWTRGQHAKPDHPIKVEGPFYGPGGLIPPLLDESQLKREEPTRG